MNSFPRLVVIQVANQEQQDAVVAGLDDLRTLSLYLNPVLENKVVRLADRSKEARVVISGEVVATGPITDMQKRYDSEAAMSPRSAVALQEWTDGEYKTKQGRKAQRANQRV